MLNNQHPADSDSMSDPEPTTRWNVVRKAKNGLYYLEFVEFESECSEAIIFERIQQLCLPMRDASSDILSHFLYSPVVYTTTFIKV
jgi:hypothetical protein